MKYGLILGLLLVLGCGDQAAFRYAISQETATQLFANATHLQTENSSDFIAVTCTFSEGFFCYYLPNPKTAAFVSEYDPLLATQEHFLENTVSNHILRELDPKRVEQAKNNTVLIKCQRTDNQISCTIHGGELEEPLGIQ